MSMLNNAHILSTIEWARGKATWYRENKPTWEKEDPKAERLEKAQKWMLYDIWADDWDCYADILWLAETHAVL